ncbi:glycosyl transferase family protein [Erythrobacter rubeus]|uniref:Glycosyl transferase family protein n=1 Tax=Erythrobacter rubeus TaxID=2760803 RepID=A0ABR8KWP1_9SPHN|nr:glycosyl transferase family protein [Erythrobacter rubeus]MBD2842637.1 glycosyl transferase family protein [Erythrobacter rubeus]
MALWGFDLWQWLALLQHELLLFAGVFFLIGALDDLAIDFTWVWLKLTGRAKTREVDRDALRCRELHGAAAIFIPAWSEAEVIGDTIDYTLGVWPQSNLRLYVGCYRNDPATIAAVMRAAQGDERLRIVIHDREGPTTKADCLNRLYDAMRDDERRMGGHFASVIFQDAEDMVDPAGLGLLDEAIEEGADFAQLPVEPMQQARSRWLGSHYCEEFAEAHAKAMVVRGELGAGLPGAGVGCAVSRGALRKLCRKRADGHPFSSGSLTEDYELGLGVSEAGGVCRFVRARGKDGLLIATRAYFPSKLGHVVRQKTRWVHGIALQGWDRVGWSSGFVETWMRARDRRGPLAALVLVIGYSLLALTAISWLAIALGFAEPVALSPLLKWLLIANFAAFIWRAAFRFGFNAREYGAAEGLMAVLRIPVSNVISIMAGRRAVAAYWKTLLGKAIEWDKTPHTAHPARTAAAERAL